MKGGKGEKERMAGKHNVGAGRTNGDRGRKKGKNKERWEHERNRDVRKRIRERMRTEMDCRKKK